MFPQAKIPAKYESIMTAFNMILLVDLVIDEKNKLKNRGRKQRKLQSNIAQVHLTLAKGDILEKSGINNGDS